MVLAGDHDVFHACVAGNSHPRIGIVLRWIEVCGVLAVFRNRDLFIVHQPLAGKGIVLTVIDTGGNR